MKKFTISAVATLLATLPAMADVETVKELYSGEDRNVTWENTLSFGAEDFADVNVGNFIYIEFAATTDVIELKTGGEKLPGSRYTNLGEGVENYSSYITEAGLAALKANGLELCGANFTVKSVSVRNDGFQMPAGAVWGGYFWIDSWNTLEIWKDAFAGYNGEKYLVVYLSEDNGENTDYIVNVLTNWGDDGVIANNDKGNITKSADKAIIDLSDVDLSAMLETTDRVMVQGDPNGGNPFNFTAVALANDISTVVSNAEVANDRVDVFNLQGVKVRSGVAASEALTDLPAGLYIVGNKKVFKTR